jgi:putative tryptophan/tyrosine transport system substrate-binding protein
MRRRDFLSLLASASAYGSRAGAQQGSAARVVGFLRSTPAEPFTHLVTPFRDGLREGGYEEGRNVTVEYLHANNDLARLRALASDLVSRRAAVVVGNDAAVRAVKAVDPSTPLVFVVGHDPVKAGLVASLNRPGGNITGLTFFGGASLDAKRLELLHEILPQGQTVAALVDSGYPAGEAELPKLEAAARALGRTIIVVRTNGDELAAAVESVGASQAKAVLVSGSPAFTSRRHTLVALTARHRLADSYDQRAFVAAGGLMSYGADFAAAYRQAGLYVARILSGAKPGELPVSQPSTFELAINLKTAKALGLTIPPSLLAQADEVIE